jgi:hypothetical protein
MRGASPEGADPVATAPVATTLDPGAVRVADDRPVVLGRDGVGDERRGAASRQNAVTTTRPTARP